MHKETNQDEKETNECDASTKPLACSEFESHRF